MLRHVVFPIYVRTVSPLFYGKILVRTVAPFFYDKIWVRTVGPFCTTKYGLGLLRHCALQIWVRGVAPFRDRKKGSGVGVTLEKKNKDRRYPALCRKKDGEGKSGDLGVSKMINNKGALW